MLRNTPAEPAAGPAPEPAEVQPKPARKPQLTITIDPDVLDELRDAAVALPSHTITSLVTEAIQQRLQQARDDHFDGEPIPPRGEVQPPVGRPIKR